MELDEHQRSDAGAMWGIRCQNSRNGVGGADQQKPRRFQFRGKMLRAVVNNNRHPWMGMRASSKSQCWRAKSADGLSVNGSSRWI